MNAPTPAPTASRPASVDNEDRFLALERDNAELRKTLNDERQEREKREKTQLRATVLAQAENWADGQIRQGAAIPAERGELVSLYSQAAVDDHDSPAVVSYRDATGTPQTGTRVQALAAVWSKRGRHDFSSEHIAPRDADPSASAASPSPGGPTPLVSLGLLPGHTGKDHILDAMLAGNDQYIDRRNGRARSDARPR